MSNNILGPRMAADLIFAVGGMDANRILNFQNRNGLSPEQIVGQAAAAAGAANEAVMARWGGSTYITTDDHARYRAGVSGTATQSKKKTEGANTDPRKGAESGHMLPIWNREYTLEWSEEWLRDAYQSQIDADIQTQVDQFTYDFEVDVLNRVLSNSNRAVGSGYDVPWAIGNDANVPYIPPPFMATNFTSTHTHFVFNAGSDAAGLKTLRNDMLKQLRHHKGLGGTVSMLVSETDVDAWAAVDGFVEINPSNVTVINGGSTAALRFVTGELQGQPGELFGFFKTNRGVIELRYLELLPTTYAWMTKSFGDNAIENGVAVRVHPNVPFGLTPDVLVTNSLQPRLQGINLKTTHGIGVNRRLNGVAGHYGAGSYTWTDLT